MHHRVIRSFVFVAIVLAGSAVPASAQRVPGFHGDYDNAAAQFRAWALSEYMEAFNGWLEALNAGDVDAALEFYGEGAVVELNGTLKGRADIATGLQEWLNGVTRVQAGLGDFEASGKLAFGSMRVVISHGPGNRSSGMLSVLMLQQGSNFRIRSQILTLH